MMSVCSAVQWKRELADFRKEILLNASADKSQSEPRLKIYPYVPSTMPRPPMAAPLGAAISSPPTPTAAPADSSVSHTESASEIVTKRMTTLPVGSGTTEDPSTVRHGDINLASAGPSTGEDPQMPASQVYDSQKRFLAKEEAQEL